MWNDATRLEKGRAGEAKSITTWTLFVLRKMYFAR